MFALKSLRYLSIAHISRNHQRSLVEMMPLIRSFSQASNVSESMESFVDNTFTGYIPIKKIDFSYSTSSGPGGQNVNRIYTKHKNSISKEGDWIIRSDKTRHQMLNVADCLDKLRCFVAEATKPPKIEPSFETLEKIRQQREKAAQKRLQEKRHRSMMKADKRIEIY
ncbi:Peptidyl-tRNA hydrolase ICT1 [Sarcoptes scabiei]|uniref:Large ribosomal subunit protein mL62 n=1 Tax=Sarcoptes scabiei TaxID=52283 RepID=A0A834VBB7_SARSC|nr:Peptidyl-tRNA hydrolase ICT1 [Sarcoptes scabiei]